MNRAPSLSIIQYLNREWTFSADDDDAVAVTDAISAWARPGNWLDLGCGPLLLVWPIWAPETTGIWGCDRNPAVREFHERLRSIPQQAWPRGLVAAVDFAQQRCSTIVSRPLGLPLDRLREVVTDDILRKRPEWRARFENVIQVGCFGCVGSYHELLHAMCLVRQYLRKTGVFISVTWSLRAGYRESRRWGGSPLAQIGAATLQKAARGGGLHVQSVSSARLSDSRYRYRHLLIATRRE